MNDRKFTTLVHPQNKAKQYMPALIPFTQGALPRVPLTSGTAGTGFA